VASFTNKTRKNKDNTNTIKPTIDTWSGNVHLEFAQDNRHLHLTANIHDAAFFLP